MMTHQFVLQLFDKIWLHHAHKENLYRLSSLKTLQKLWLITHYKIIKIIIMPHVISVLQWELEVKLICQFLPVLITVNHSMLANISLKVKNDYH